jgi:ornithine--oxo-acid transaminase
MNTGAEAVETAIKCARRWGHRVKGIPDGDQRILVARGNFHGRTSTIIGFSSEEEYRSGFGPFCGGFQHFDYGDMDSVKAAATRNTCAVLIEPIQGEAGVLVPPPGFFRALRDWCTAQNILLIDDEVQAGLGRTGKWFAFEHEGIRPDALILGKALGAGLLPVSAFCADDKVMSVFVPNSHGSTFGGNALAAAVALEGLKVLEEEGLVAHCAKKGEYLFRRLREVQADVQPLIRDVRGRGLWIGVDIEPSCTSARDLVERLAAAGVLSKETHDTVIRFAPPLTISFELMDRAVELFRGVAVQKVRELGLPPSAAAAAQSKPA